MSEKKVRELLKVGNQKDNRGIEEWNIDPETLYIRILQALQSPRNPQNMIYISMWARHDSYIQWFKRAYKSNLYTPIYSYGP